MVRQLAVQLSSQVKKQETRRRSNEQRQNTAEEHKVPKREARPDVLWSKANHSALSLRTNPTPLTVWSSLAWNGSSNLRLSLAMFTSMTLSSGVCRGPSFQTSRAIISRETTRA